MTIPFFDDLITILNNQLITLNHNELKSLYVKWSSEFYDDLRVLSDIISKDSIKDNQNVPSHSFLNGIDLPTWFGDFKNKKVMFLGIDPMRNNKDFEKLDADKKNDVIIGTPYAFHLKGFRENRTSSYWNVIKEVSKSNFVYVTDIYKTFFYTGYAKKMRSYDFWNMPENKLINQNHRSLLVEEINFIEPDIIVTFGALAYKVLTNQKYCPKLSLSLSDTTKKIAPFSNQGVSKERPITILPLMHLSGSTRGEPLENFFKANGLTYSDKNDKRIIAGKLYGKIIKDYVEEIN